MAIAAESAKATGVTCVLCGAAGARLFEVNGYWVCRCGGCGHRYAQLEARDGHVERTYGDEYFSGGGAGYSNYLSEERLLIDRGRWYARRSAPYCDPGTVLDVGAAAGFALQGFREAGWHGRGIEPNAAMAAYARQRFGFDVETASFESWTADGSFDLVTMFQVLPHFVDPQAALCKAAELTRPGGHLLIETWNVESWTARLCGKNWHEYSPPSVLHWFSKHGLIRLAECAGFRSVAGGRPSKWISAEHAKSLLRDKSQRSMLNQLLLAMGRLVPDRLALPYPAEDLCWLLFDRATGS